MGVGGGGGNARGGEGKGGTSTDVMGYVTYL